MRYSQSAIQKFFELAADAERIDSEMTQPVEPALESVLIHVLAHPELRSQFSEAFLLLAHDPNLGPPELVEYCMHALKWPEIKDELTERLEKESRERARHMLKKFLMAFDDDWALADLYSRFKNK